MYDDYSSSSTCFCLERPMSAPKQPRKKKTPLDPFQQLTRLRLLLADVPDCGCRLKLCQAHADTLIPCEDTTNCICPPSSVRPRTCEHTEGAEEAMYAQFPQWRGLDDDALLAEWARVLWGSEERTPGKRYSPPPERVR